MAHNERSNEAWLRALRDPGVAGDVARGELRAELVAGLRRALARRPAVTDALVEDAAQEALVRVLGALDGFRDESRLTTWALAIGVRVVFNELRRARWRDVSFDVLTHDAATSTAFAEPGPGPEGQLARRRALGALERVMATELTERQRRVLVAELRGMPQEEIAAQLGTSRNALYKLGHDARQKLRRGLEREGLTADDVRAAFAE